jgi:RWP-RK domain
MQEAYYGTANEDTEQASSQDTAPPSRPKQPRQVVHRQPGQKMPRPSTNSNVVPSKEDLEQCDTLEKLQSVFHLPINDAAAALDMGVTVLKKLCRDRQINRWPFRKLSSVDKLIESVQVVRVLVFTSDHQDIFRRFRPSSPP